MTASIVITYRYTATLAASSVKILVNVEMSASMDDAIFVKSLGSWPKCLGFYNEPKQWHNESKYMSIESLYYEPSLELICLKIQ